MIRLHLDSRLRRRITESDIFQEACLKAKKSPKKTMSFDFFVKILMRTIRQRNFKHLLAPDGSVRHEQNTQHLDVATESSITHASESEDTYRRIEQMIESMSSQRKQVLKLVHLRKMSIVQAAKYIGITEEACRKRYQRALKQLQIRTQHLRD